MAYKPSLEDIMPSKKTSGYQPSLSDISENEEVNPKKAFQEMTSINKPDYTALQSLAQGMAKGGQKIAQLLPGAPNYNMEGVFGNKKTDPQAEMVGQYLPSIASGVAGLPGIVGAGLYGASQAKQGNRLEEGLYSSLGALGGNVLGKGMTGISSLINKARGKLDPGAVAKLAQNSHDLMNNKASNIFQNVEKQAYSRGINEIPINKNIFEIIKERDLFPKTSASKQLIKKAESGDYQSLRKLQSDLGQRGSDASLSKFMADRDKGAEMLDIREKINKSISNHLKNTGNEDLANELNQGRDIYKNMKKIYYTDKRLGRLVHPEKLEVPENVEKLFSKNSKTMNQFRQLHPEITNALHQLNTLKSLKRLGIGGSGLLGGIGLLKALKPRSSNTSSNE